MPTVEHNGLVEMFRANPSLGPHFLATLFHVEVPPHASVSVVEASLDQLLPIEFRADLVLALRDAAGALVMSIILEVQRDKDTDKKYSWPVYLVVERAKKRCPACVLVVAPDAEVAAWAGEPIDLGVRSVIHPLVLGPSVVPVVTDEAFAEEEAELAILSALSHGNGPRGLDVVQAALAALKRFDQDHTGVYFHLIYKMLREPLQRAVEALIMDKELLAQATWPPFLEEAFKKRESKSKLEGKLEGRLEGKLEGNRETLLRLLKRAAIPLTPEQHDQIQTCADLATLDRWIENVLGAKTAADVLT